MVLRYPAVEMWFRPRQYFVVVMLVWIRRMEDDSEVCRRDRAGYGDWQSDMMEG